MGFLRVIGEADGFFVCGWGFSRLGFFFEEDTCGGLRSVRFIGSLGISEL